MKPILYLFLLFIFLNSCTSNPENKLPNIVFILADDMGYSQLGCNGSTYYQTPNIDRLAIEGMRFTNAYAACAVCSPTRASIMTGKYPARLHLTDFIAGNNNNNYPLTQPEWQKWLPLEEITIAEVLKQQGYKTALFGKWHLSKEKLPPESLPFNPDKQGFDETFITYKPSKGLAQPWQSAEIDAHNVDTITHLSVKFMEQNKNRPFFLMVSHNTIHDPLKEKAKTIKKYERLPSTEKPENHPVIAAMIERLDKSCGILLNTLQQLGIEKNTIVIFFSDNGGKNSYAAQTPFRAGKGWLYEGGIREPLIIKWPKHIERNTVSEALISSIDFLPTFAEICGNTKLPENIDGKSFVKVFADTDAEVHQNLFWHYPHYHNGSGMKPAGAVRNGRYKLVEWYEKSLSNDKNACELFDLENDKSETINLADSLPEITSGLKQLLHIWRTDVSAQMPTINKNAAPN